MQYIMVTRNKITTEKYLLVVIREEIYEAVYINNIAKIYQFELPTDFIPTKDKRIVVGE
nr:hypothetical protein [Enterococcus cecorum]